MKRHVTLLQLSREHHRALVLARRIEQFDAAGSHQEILASVTSIFRRELEPHFQAEEADLLPRLGAAGELDLVQRTLREHQYLRALAARIAAGAAADLKPFGLALQAHVRFEERELFPVAEAALAENVS
jgi:hemerythrin-like domain-containing protein